MGQISKNYGTFYPKSCHQALKNMSLGSGIRNKPIPYPGSKGQKGTGSRIRIPDPDPQHWFRAQAVNLWIQLSQKNGKNVEVAVRYILNNIQRHSLRILHIKHVNTGKSSTQTVINFILLKCWIFSFEG